IREVIDDHYPELRQLMKATGSVPALRFDAVYCYAKKDENGDPCEPGLKHHGYPVLALIKSTKLKDRVKGMGDVEIVINGDEWMTMDDAHRRAIIDHELYHLSPKTDGNGTPKRDDLRRPLFGMRLHDVQVGWFAAVANRNGSASAERIQAHKIVENYHQEIFPFIKEWDVVGGGK
ncbi:MAG: putative metallopeptidase, partial [Verrucomicrobiota bacterium]